jgi:hypothetical protein
LSPEQLEVVRRNKEKKSPSENFVHERENLENDKMEENASYEILNRLKL